VALAGDERREPVQPGCDQLLGELAARQPDLPQAFAAAVEVRHRGPQHAIVARGALNDRLRVDRHLLVAGEPAGDQLVDDSLGPSVLKNKLIHLRIITSIFSPQVTSESFEVVLNQRGVKATFERAPRGKRNRLRITVRHLVEKVHRL
jgi:hypothetical protein